jgi:hypothetical protein
MSDFGQRPSGQGHAWRGGWRKRLADLLRRKGFGSLTSYAQAKPLETLGHMVEDLGAGDVAAVQLQWILVEEARKCGTLRECARDLLIRLLREVDGGWPGGNGWEERTDVRFVLIEWGGSLRDEGYNNAMRKIVETLLLETNIPKGWIPEGLNDLRAGALFDKFWPSSTERRGSE